MDKFSNDYIKGSGSVWKVYSHKGKVLGTYTSKAAAAKRLRQIEFYKRHPQK